MRCKIAFADAYVLYCAQMLTWLQHLAATGPNIDILRDFLAQGASVHLRNRSGNTPLFLAASAGLRDHVEVLREAGAHLHTDEMATARMHAAEDNGNAALWELATG